MPRHALMLALSSFAFLGLASAQTTAARPVPPPGGANQRTSQEGCVNEWLFNGIWRLRVTDLRPISAVLYGPTGTQFGWQATVELRNGTRERLHPLQTGFEIASSSENLILPDGSTLQPTAGQNDLSKNLQRLPQGGLMKLDLKFYAEPKQPQPPRPVKLLFAIEPGKLQAWQFKARYTTKDPSFRVFLNCEK